MENTAIKSSLLIKSIKLNIFAFFLLLCLPVEAIELVGRVIKVVDGDTVHFISKDNLVLKVRLEGIDAPERGQPWGKQATKELDRILKINDYKVKLRYNEKDRYGRVIGTIFDPQLVLKENEAGYSVNSLMVLNGYAWAFVRYSDKYVSSQQWAQENKRGMWASSETHMPPWEWRKLN